MQVLRLRMVVDECARDLSDEGAIAVEGYYLHNGKWWRVSDSSEVDTPLKSELEKCVSSGLPFRTKHSRFANFPLVQMEAVVRAEFSAPVRSPRFDAVQRVVGRSHRNATNAFSVK